MAGVAVRGVAVPVAVFSSGLSVGGGCAQTWKNNAMYWNWREAALEAKLCCSASLQF